MHVAVGLCHGRDGACGCARESWGRWVFLVCEGEEKALVGRGLSFTLACSGRGPGGRKWRRRMVRDDDDQKGDGRGTSLAMEPMASFWQQLSSASVTTLTWSTKLPSRGQRGEQAHVGQAWWHALVYRRLRLVSSRPQLHSLKNSDQRPASPRAMPGTSTNPRATARARASSGTKD